MGDFHILCYYINDDDHYSINIAPTTGVSRRQRVSGKVIK